MHNLPVEVASKIFREACFDDQATGRSLSLTSKWINDVVQPVRFEAISLYGTSQTIKFASMLDELPLGTLKIRHLFVSGIDTKTAEDERITSNEYLRKLAVQLDLTTETDADCFVDKQPVSDYAASGWPPWDQWLTSHSAQRHNVHAGFNRALIKVLQHAAASIQTLFLTAIPFGIRSPIHISMPNLTDLSCTSKSRVNEIKLKPSPRLRRIHTDSSFYVFGNHMDQVDFRTCAPVLEELRVTCIEELSSTFVRAVVACVHDTQPWLQKLYFPKSMKRVLLQQSPPCYWSWCGTGANMTHEEFTKYLYQAASEVAEIAERQGGFQLVLLEKLDVPLWLKGKIDGLSYTFHDARRDWQDVISGGKGAWDDSYAITDLQAWIDDFSVFDIEYDSDPVTD